jgi:hypothetical protein
MAIESKGFDTAVSVGALDYKGTYNATTNSPILTSSLKSDYYVVSGPGVLAGIALEVGDIVLFNQNASSPITSAMFNKFDNTDQVISVNAQTGLVVLDTDDITETATNQYFTNARFDTQLATKDTSNLTEGSNLYYTNARFDTQLATKDSDDVTEGSSNLYYTNARFDTQLATKDTDNLTEGSSNLYYTNARFDTQLATKDTSNLTEGTNLYHTNARVDARIALANANDLNDVSYTAGAPIDGQVLTYVHANNQWEAAAASGGISSVNGDTGPTVVLDSDDVAEGSSNLYYTNARFDTQLATKDTSNLTEGTNLYYTNARFDTQLATKDTSNLTEGTNLYHTNARVDARIALANANDLNDVSYTAGAPIDGQVLTYVHANNRWEAAAASGGGGGFTYDGSKGAASFTAVLSYHYAVNTSGASGNITMTLPAAASGGSEIRIKLLDATHNVIVAPATGEKLDTVINGTTTLSAANQSITLVDNGTDGWEIV